jgi:tRNA(Ile)-lysidine synthase
LISINAPCTVEIMVNGFELRLTDLWPPKEWQDVTVLVAISGGADSVALLRALIGLKTEGAGRICAAHLNHRLRLDAEADEQFVRELCERLNIVCEVERAEASQIAAMRGEGMEEAARRLRYDFLSRAAGKLGARYVATAHTADDQAETILHRIVRGTGLRGLSGMARTRTLGHVALIRPFLGFRRSEIESYLAELDQPFRQDASNFDCRFTRNRIRHELFPLLIREYNHQAFEAILRLSTLASELQPVVAMAVEKIYEQQVRRENKACVKIDVTGLDTTPPYLLRELFMLVWRRQSWPLQAMGFAEWSLLEKMLRESIDLSPKSCERRSFPGGIQVEAAHGEMRLKIS